MRCNEFKNKLVEEISKCGKVKGIGQTGDINLLLVPGQSDIDMFVLCTEIPDKEERITIYNILKENYTELMMEVCNGGIWGYGDIMVCDDIEVMPMYFTISEMEDYLVKTLNGDNLWKDGRFYPTGRLASVESINVLYEEDGIWTRLVDKVKEHPDALFLKLFESQISCVIDEEDISRVLLRKEVLFYHQVLEDAIDHLLQALFALNKCYFPSRKRTLTYIEKFNRIPENFYNRVLLIIEKSTKQETMVESIEELKLLTNDLKLA